MTNQMPERIYVAYGGTVLDNPVYIALNNSADAKNPESYYEYLRADLAQKTVTREELDKIVYEKADEWHNTSGNKWSIEHYIVDYLVTTGIIKASD